MSTVFPSRACLKRYVEIHSQLHLAEVSRDYWADRIEMLRAFLADARNDLAQHGNLDKLDPRELVGEFFQGVLDVYPSYVGSPTWVEDSKEKLVEELAKNWPPKLESSDEAG